MSTEGTFKEPEPVKKIEPPLDTSVYRSGISLNQAQEYVTSANMQKLCQKDTFEINGKTYKRRKLNPRRKAELESTITKYAKTDDENINEKLRLQLLTAQIALENFTEADFNDENLDSFMLDQVVAACLLIAKSFRQI